MKRTIAIIVFYVFTLSACAENKPPQCDRRAGQADSYVLALSSHQGFCETYGYEAGKLECTAISGHDYASQNLVLHGLWPNQKACGVQYGYCGVQMQSNHCDYSPVSLTDPVNQRLKSVMPSFDRGTCLERHEWSKHGSCQLESSDLYFERAVNLTYQVNDSAFVHFIAIHKGETVTRGTLRALITASFGEAADKRVYLGCKNGILVDVFMSLPKTIHTEERLPVLLSQAPYYGRRDDCLEQIKLSNFNVG